MTENFEEDIIDIINLKIAPMSLNEKGRSTIKKLLNQYQYTLVLECVEISFSTYINYDENGNATKESVENFINKIGGIAYNKSLSPLVAKIRHIVNLVRNDFSYFDSNKAQALINSYVKALRSNDYSDDMIIKDFDEELIPMIGECKNWSEWKSRMELWINNVYDWNNSTKSIEIDFTDSIIPKELFEKTPGYITKICQQINASYDNNLFDCAAVMMRRLVDVLLILSFQNLNIETQILNKDTNNYISLDRIIKKAENSKELKLSTNTKKNMGIYKTLGNFSAHKIWYNSTQSDIKNNILFFRALV